MPCNISDAMTIRLDDKLPEYPSFVEGIRRAPRPPNPPGTRIPSTSRNRASAVSGVTSWESTQRMSIRVPRA